MGQVTIYIDDETEKKMVAAARARRMSKSKWITDLIREKVAGDWPESVRQLAGAWDDFPDLDEIRAGSATDSKRETL